MRQVNHSDGVPDRIIGIATNLHLVAISLRMQFAHQPFPGIQPDSAIIGFKARVVGDLQRFVRPCLDLLASRPCVCAREPAVPIIDIPLPDGAGADRNRRIGADLGQCLARRKPPQNSI